MHYLKAIENLIKHGQEIETRGRKCKELINQQIIVNGYNIVFNEYSREYNKIKNYLIGEFSWYFSGSRNVEDINYCSKFWNNVCDEQGKLNSNYGYQIFYNINDKYSSYDWCLKSLIEDKNSRQAIAIYNDREGFYDNNKDFICTQNQQFMIRNNELISIVSLRSSDVIYGLTYDIPWYKTIQQQLKWDLIEKYPELKCGTLYINIGSMHVYENHYSTIKEILANDRFLREIYVDKKIPLYKDIKWYKENLENYIWFTR